MPGFNVGSSPSQKVGASQVEPKFKYRWRFKFVGMNTFIMAEKAKRPSVKWNEVKLKKGHETIYFSADIVWEPITITFYDFESDPNTTLELFKYLKKHNPMPSKKEWSLVGPKKAPTDDYKFRAELEMLNNYGDSIEKWHLYGSWIQSIVFGELTYTASDIVKVDVTIRFDRAETYISTSPYVFPTG